LDEVKLLVTCLGIIVIDVFAAGIPYVAKPGELVLVKGGVKTSIGGHCANVSINLRQLGVRRGDVGAIGTVGNDVFGDFAEKKLNEHGVVPYIKHVSKAETSKDLILVVKGEDRRFHFDPGANHYVEISKGIEVLSKEKPELLYVGLAGISKRLDLKIVNLLQSARSLDITTFVDPIMPIPNGVEFIRNSSRLIDVLHCNDKESLSLTRAGHVEGAAKRLLKRGIPLIIVSKGKDGLVAAFKNKIIHMPSFRVKTLDPTGAGDAFCAGAIRRLMKGGRKIEEFDISEVLDLLLYGSATGAACVTGIGTTTNVKSSLVNKILKDQRKEVISRTVIKHFNN
jgi:sugar/nucleoside kinase (ribokinase family)